MFACLLDCLLVVFLEFALTTSVMLVRLMLVRLWGCGGFHCKCNDYDCPVLVFYLIEA